MSKHITFCLFLVIGLTVNAQTINVRGTVSNKAGKPILNAIVTLVRQGLKDTTGTDGAYTISHSTAVELPFSAPEIEQIALNANRGILELSLTRSSPVKVEIFNAKGDLYKRVFTGRPGRRLSFYYCEKLPCGEPACHSCFNRQP